MRKYKLILISLIVFIAVVSISDSANAGIHFSPKYVGNTMVDISWTEYESTDFSKYELLRGGTLLKTITDRTEVFYRDAELTKGNTYVYYLHVYNTTGWLKESETTTVTTGEVHGTITLDTTWKAASSPYTLTGDVNVREGSTLTIESTVETVNQSHSKPQISVEENGTLYAHNVTITEINLEVHDYAHITNCTLEFARLDLYTLQDSLIKGNNLSGYGGIFLYDSTKNNTIEGNTVRNNSYTGIGLSHSSDTRVIGNTVLDIARYGFYGINLYYSSNNKIIGNTVDNIPSGGIGLYYSNTNDIVHNYVSNNNEGIGIHLDSSDHNDIFDNNNVSNNYRGIRFYDSSSNNITGNAIQNNSYFGIYLHAGSGNNIIRGNHVRKNGNGYGGGVFLDVSSTNNRIYNNYFNNTRNAYDSGNNSWNITKISGLNIVNGPYLGGNYWSDYAGIDNDTPPDGLGDTFIPYNSSGKIYHGGDYHPLIAVGARPPLNVEIESPESDFVAHTAKYEWQYVTISATVTDDQNTTLNGSSIDSVVASFTTNAQRTPPNLTLYDDGAHVDGYKDDGIYANVWRPDQAGDYTITVTAKKSGFLDGVDTVNGIVIVKPNLEIPAQFKHVHPYKDYEGKDAPVFQRGVENPQFKISNLTGAQPTGVKLVIEIQTPEETIVKNVTESWSATPILVEWDWSTTVGPQNPSDIPVGLYGATAKLVNSSTNTTLEESDLESFYVIFNYQIGDRYVTSPRSVVLETYPNGSWVYKAYPLHQYNATIWRDALVTVDGCTKVKDASCELRLFAYDIGGRGHNYPANPRGGQNMWWYNGGTLTFLEKGSGVCVDYAALMAAYCRAVGIPARFMTGHPMDGNRHSHIGHAWVEIWDHSWYWYEPTWAQTQYPEWLLGGTYGTDLYAAMGLEFRPLPRYLVAAPPPDGFGKINVYDRYTFCADVVDVTFTNEPPGGYDYGQTVQCNVTAANWGAITISQPLNVSIYEDVVGGLSLTAEFPLRIDRGDKVIANTLDASRLASASFSWTLPDYGPQSSFFERVYERYVVVVVYYRDRYGRKIQTDSFKTRIPGLCIRPHPFITVDEERRELSNATYSYIDQTDEMRLKTETFVLDVPAVMQTRTEHEAAENYSQAVVTIDNPDNATHNYSYSLQVAGRGDALYLPALGSITSNCTGLNVTTNYLLSYEQASGTNDYISIHEFSQNVTIDDIEFIEYKGVRGMLINVTWNLSLDRYSSQDFAIYFSRRGGDGVSIPEIYTALAEEIVDNGDSLSTLRIATPGHCRVGDTHPINVTIFNNGVTSETINVTLNMTKVIGTVPYTAIGLYNDTALTTVPPQTAKNVTFMVAVPEQTTSGVWDIQAKTDKGIEATSVFDVEDAFDLICTHNITVPQYSSFTFNATVTNTWDTAVHDVNITLDFFYGFHSPDLTEKQLGTLSPSESRTVSWHLNATASGELPLEVFVTSSDGGFDTTDSTITSLAPPELWIPNVIFRTTNPDSGTAKTVFVNATIYNLGDVPAPDVQLQLILPENVTSTVLNRDVGDLSGRGEKNVSLDITFDTQSDFAFAVVASDDANRSAIGTVMISLLGPALPDLTLTSEDIQFILPSSGYTSSVGQRTLFQPFYNGEIASDALKLELEESGDQDVKFTSSVETINSSWTLSPPTIDGTLATGEWGDAIKIDITYHTGDNSSMFVMNDEENLYIAFDVVNDTTNDLNTQDVVQLGFDGDHDDLTAPYNTDPFYAGGTGVDLWAKLRGNTTESRAGWLTVNEAGTECSRWYYPGNPTGPQVLATGFSAHRTYEYSVPLATALNISTGDIVGFNVLINDGLGTPDTGDFRTQGLWPSTWNGLCDFSADGDLVLATAPTVELATVKATIHNIGWVDAGDVVVQFFDGDPDSGGIQIGKDQINLSIPVGETGSAEVCWDITEEVGSHVIYVQIDANNTEAELNEANNLAFKHIGVPGVRCFNHNVTIDPAKTSVTDDPVGDGYDLSDAPANVNMLIAKGFTINATGPDGTYPFNITFLSPVVEDFVLFKLPGWVEIPYVVIDTYTIQAHLEISGGFLDPDFIFAALGIFDTGFGSYPSVSGIHNGTITPSQNLTVSKLYTYPCHSTGGHTEYVKIMNSTTGWNVTATWNGYTGDWHNLTFDTPFTLYANQTYNYTIRTGSYPQIHHTSSLPTAAGWINCTSFEDANGKRECYWIPAIRLS